jgi:hypothetical protein
MAISASGGWLAVVVGLAAIAELTPGVALGQAPSTPTARTSPAAARAASGVASAVMPGFETLADGSSRLFVELSKPVAYDTKAARGSVTYVLKGVRVLRRNNTNALVTVHFNTPVTSARLVPHGKDLWFVVDLRADVQPAVSMDAGKDGTAVMHIELPKGAYLPAPSSSSAASPPDSPTAAPAGAPAPANAPAR